MANIKIEVLIRIVETDESVQDIPQKNANGNFSLVINDKASTSIDQVEKSLLDLNYPAIRDAMSAHFTETSKKKPAQRPLNAKS